MKRIETVAQLKQEAAYNDTKPAAKFFIPLKGGGRIRIHIVYYPDTGTFDIFHAADNCREENITEEQLENDTPVVQAIHSGASLCMSKVSDLEQIAREASGSCGC